MLQDKTYYEVLNLSEDASSEDIKQAYRSLIKLWHPDINPDKPDAATVTQMIIEAYGILSDPNKRSQYDEYLSFTRPEKDMVQPDAASEPDYSYMPFEDYVGHTAFGAASAWQDAFDERTHKFDEEGYKEYVKKNGMLKKEVNAPKGFIVILVLMPLVSILFLNRGRLFSGVENTGIPILPLILAAAGVLGAWYEIHKRNVAAREERAKRLGGIDSTNEADKWFDVWLYPEMPVSDCRKAFFAFSVRADRHILSRFNMLSDEEKKEYADIIELLTECINYREKK